MMIPLYAYPLPQHAYAYEGIIKIKGDIPLSYTESNMPSMWQGVVVFVNAHRKNNITPKRHILETVPDGIYEVINTQTGIISVPEAIQILKTVLNTPRPVQYSPFFVHIFEKLSLLCEEEAMSRCQRRAVATISDAWIRVSIDPHHPIGKKCLMRKFSEMENMFHS